MACHPPSASLLRRWQGRLWWHGGRLSCGGMSCHRDHSVGLVCREVATAATDAATFRFGLITVTGSGGGGDCGGRFFIVFAWPASGKGKGALFDCFWFCSLSVIHFKLFSRNCHSFSCEAKTDDFMYREAGYVCLGQLDFLLFSYVLREVRTAIFCCPSSFTASPILQ